jgi:hypothetical protein
MCRILTSSASRKGGTAKEVEVKAGHLNLKEKARKKSVLRKTEKGEKQKAKENVYIKRKSE